MEQYIKYSIFFILKIGRLKGKQVQVLYDLVTVSVEHSARYVTDAVHREGGGVQ